MKSDINDLREKSLRSRLLEMIVAFEQHREKTGIYEDWQLSGKLEALIQEEVRAARIFELQHVDRHTNYYPDGSEPIEAQTRIAQLTKEQSNE